MDSISETNETQNNQVEADPWAAAFSALEQVGESDTKGSSADNGDGMVSTGELENTDGDDSGEGVSDQSQAENGEANENDSRGLDNASGINDSENRNAFTEHLEITEEEITEYKTKFSDDIRNKAINDIAQEFIKRGIRHNSNGALGATLDDSDICKHDEDGVPRFYNPETGKEFTGDNPRRQAQEWVDDYNKELARVFNESCAKYEEHLMQEGAPAIAVMEFVPKYNKLDPIRKGMFENVIEDYEITNDEGKVVGYSCDLDKALALVDRQVAMIQNYAKEHQGEKQQPSGPALDMKTSSGAVTPGDKAAPSSLAEAMERLQDEQLSKLKEK